jgi:hypothetical protein
MTCRVWVARRDLRLNRSALPLRVALVSEYSQLGVSDSPAQLL